MKINAQRLHEELFQLATFTHAEPSSTGTAVTRIVFSAEDLAARAWLKSLATTAGLNTREDAAGNTFFRLRGTDPTLPAIATGSHIDAIPHAGMYDGTVGVLGGLEALRAIQSAAITPRRSIELILFTSEEPTRFGIGCLGSRILTGSLLAQQADGLQEDSGRTLAQVREAAGFPGPLASILPGHYHAFLELHIEQGPILEREHQEIGIVTSIAAPAGYRFVLQGHGGHAGTLLMPDRRDALCAAAELILAVERHAKATGSIDTVATIGTCDVHPGAVNSVPSRVTLQLDIRDTDPVRREAVMQLIRADVAAIASSRDITVSEQQVNADQPATCDPHLTSLLKNLAQAASLSYRQMVSRAYHDTLFMAAICPVAMIFIPCRAGISHRPEEYAAPADIARGTQLLAEALLQLALE